MQDGIGQRPIGSFETLIVEKVHLVGGHHRHLVQDVITGGSDTKFTV
jgi:hypothetical protein